MAGLDACCCGRPAAAARGLDAAAVGPAAVPAQLRAPWRRRRVAQSASGPWCCDASLPRPSARGAQEASASAQRSRLWVANRGATSTVLLPVSLLLALLPGRPVAQQDYSSVCPHYNYDNVFASELILEGVPRYKDIRKNQTHLYFYENRNLSTQLRAHEYRNLIINLEPCRGTVYLFIWKTRHCYPNPYSCIDLTPGEESRSPGDCDWTYFQSEIDGSKDGTQTFFEIPFTSTKWYLAVFAPENAAYTLTVLADTGWLPRPGSFGRLYASQTRELEVDLMWDIATYSPAGYTATKQYWIYSTMLLDDDNRTSMKVFLRKDKILNTVCGLLNNTDQQYTRVPASTCRGNRCNATVKGVVTGWRYAFNVVAESEAGFFMAYAGIILRTDWEVERIATSDKTLEVIGAISGGVVGMVIVAYFLLLKLYG